MTAIKQLEYFSAAQIKHTLVAERWRISTIMLDHPANVMGRAMDILLDPLLGRPDGKYETMVFDVASASPTMDLSCDRADTEEAAIANHDRRVRERAEQDDAAEKEKRGD